MVFQQGTVGTDLSCDHPSMLRLLAMMGFEHFQVTFNNTATLLGAVPL